MKQGLYASAVGLTTGLAAYILTGGGMTVGHIDTPMYVPLSIWTYVGLFLLFPGGLLWAAGVLIGRLISHLRR